jgi:hypothetical protein
MTIYGSGPLPDITVDVGGTLRRSMTLTDIEHTAAMMGAGEIQVHEDHEQHHVGVRVSQLSVEDREDLQTVLRDHTAPGVTLDVTALDGDDTDDDGDYLTDQELLTVMRCLPDDWGPGDDIEFGEVDWCTLKPLADDFGGVRDLAEATKRSVAASPDRAQDAHNLRAVAEASERRAERIESADASHPPSTNETSQQPAQRREADAVGAAKDAYVSGDIGILELEDRLEDAIELEHPPTATPP